MFLVNFKLAALKFIFEQADFHVTAILEFIGKVQVKLKVTEIHKMHKIDDFGTLLCNVILMKKRKRKKGGDKDGKNFPFLCDL